MPQAQWTAVDDYLSETLLKPDSALVAALQANTAAGLPAIEVAPNQGKFLQLLAQMLRARRILEIGTLGGYSTIWLARALPSDGKLITLELNPKHAEVAQSNLDRAGLTSLVEVRTGPALQSLAQLEREHPDPFDLIFIDADKPNNPHYLDFALKLSRPGTLILCDNVIRDGAVANAHSSDPNVLGARHLLKSMAAHPRLSATALQTVGSKGWDGFAMALVVDA